MYLMEAWEPWSCLHLCINILFLHGRWAENTCMQIQVWIHCLNYIQAWWLLLHAEVFFLPFLTERTTQSPQSVGRKKHCLQNSWCRLICIHFIAYSYTSNKMTKKNAVENIFKRLYNPYSAPWRHQLYLYSFLQSLVGLYCIPMAPLPSHATSQFAPLPWLFSICPKSFLLPIKPTHLEKRLFPFSFKSAIISSLHGWLILPLHPFLNRCLDSSDSLKFPYHQPHASTNSPHFSTSSTNIQLSHLGCMPSWRRSSSQSCLPFHTHESN